MIAEQDIEDLAAKFPEYTRAIAHGEMTINQCRQAEGLDGIGPAGDIRYVPVSPAEVLELAT